MSQNFYRIWPDYGRDVPKMLDRTMSLAGGKLGPFAALHLECWGRGWRSIGSGFPRDAPPDRIVYQFDSRRPLLDFMSGAHSWVISNAAHDILVRYAKNAIDLAPVEVLMHYNEEDRPVGARWQCDVIRFEDAVDETASDIHWTDDGKRYDSNSKLVFRADLPADLHLFRIWHDPATVACSAELRDALLAAKLTGIVFERFKGDEP